MTDETISFDCFHPEPLMIVISGPSGVGKDSVLNGLKERDMPLHFVVTATTRKPRVNEVDGVDYFFVSLQEFEHMIAMDQLLEYAVVYNQYKGIPKEQIRKAFESGRDVILRVDVQGAARLRSLYPEAVLIFLIPSSQEEWIDRLQKRNSDTPENLVLRLSTARHELECLDNFDYIVLNAHERLDEAVENIAAIIQAEHHRVNHRKIRI